MNESEVALLEPVARRRFLALTASRYRTGPDAAQGLSRIQIAAAQGDRAN